MTVLEKYLYNDFNYKIEGGRKPFLVNGITVYTYTTIPQVIWELDFGTVTSTLKNAIERSIFTDYDNLYFRSFVGPDFMIAKYVDILTNDISYFLTYTFEHAYYSNFVYKPIEYTVEGSNHVLEGGIVIPANQSSSDDPIVITRAELKRKLQFLSSTIKLIHKANDIHTMKLTFAEQAQPISVSGAFIVGVSNADYNTTC